MTVYRRIAGGQALAELARRAKRQQFSPEEIFRGMPLALAFVLDPSLYLVAMCARRAGKTYACALRLLLGAWGTKRPYLYVTNTRKNAKKNIWPDLCRLNREYDLGGKVDHTELSITWGDHAGVWLTGCLTERETDRIRGSKYAGIVIDEAQAFPAWLSSFIDEEIMLTLADYDGWLAMTGTPPNVWVGAFCDTWDKGDVWSKHHWTAFENPHLDINKLLRRELHRRGVDEDDPSIQREFYGRYAYDPSALVIPYGERAHLVGELAKYDYYLIAYDIGLWDADAIVVLGWTMHSQVVDCVYEYACPRRDISALGAQLAELRDKYRPIRIVGDTGGLGAKAALEITNRYRVPIEPAIKTDKLLGIRLLRDAVNSGRFRCSPTGPLAAEFAKMQWDLEARAKGIEKIDDQAYHPDLGDAAIYGYRECLAFLQRPKPEPKPIPDQIRAELIERQRESQTRSGRWWRRPRQRPSVSARKNWPARGVIPS